MATIVSSHTEPLVIPMGGQVLRPGVPAVVARWDIVQCHDTVKAWLAAGVLTVVDDAKDEPVLEPQADPEPTLDDLRRQAEMIGLEVDRRWGEDRLRQEIAKAQEA